MVRKLIWIVLLGLFLVLNGCVVLVRKPLSESDRGRPAGPVAGLRQPGSGRPAHAVRARPSRATTHGRHLVQNGKLWGYVDDNGHWCVPPTHLYALPFSEGLAVVADRYGGRFDVIDEQGRKRYTSSIPGSLDFRPNFDLWVYLDGRLAVPDGAGSFTFCYLDHSGKIVFTIDHIGTMMYAQFREGLLMCGHDGHYGYRNPAGEYVIAPDYRFAKRFGEGLAAVEIDRKWGFIDKTGAVVIKPQFLGAEYFAEGLCPAEANYAWGYIDHTGTFVIQPQFPRAFSFTGGAAMVQTRNGQYAYIDHAGNVIYRFKGVNDRPFHEGLARVGLPGGYGYIDTHGKIALPGLFSAASDFHDGFAVVAKDGHQYLLRKNGKAIPVEPWVPTPDEP